MLIQWIVLLVLLAAGADIDGGGAMDPNGLDAGPRMDDNG